MEIRQIKFGLSYRWALKFLLLSILISFGFSCAKHQDRPQSLISQISSNSGIYKVLNPKFSDSALNQNGSTDKPISLVKIQIKGVDGVCLAYVGPYYSLETIAYRHLPEFPESNNRFEFRKCDDPKYQALVQWHQVRISPEGVKPAQHAYVKIVKAPKQNAPDQVVDFVFMGLLYRSADALKFNWKHQVQEHKEETFLGFLKRLEHKDIVDSDSGAISQSKFTANFLDLIVNQVFIPKTNDIKFHHFQGPFSLIPTSGDDAGWNMLTSTFQRIPGEDGIVRGRDNFCMISSDIGYVVTNNANGDKPCARVKIIPDQSDKQYYYEISPGNTL